MSEQSNLKIAEQTTSSTLADSKLLEEKAAISSHYDLPPQFFAKFLDPRMAYSCAYFTDESNSIAQAQENKLELLCRKLMITQDDHVLDIGCGWGSFLFYAAEKYGCKTTGITLAEEQVKTVKEKAREKGLDHLVNAMIMHAYDMQFEDQAFDKIVTVGAIEHMDDLDSVFRGSYRTLKDEGLFLVHGMTQPWRKRRRMIAGEKSEVTELLNEHFGIGFFKSLWEVMGSLEKAGFEVLDHENITRHYQLTVEKWLENLEEKEIDIVDKIIPEEKYREFLVFMASYIVSFESSGTFANQILCKKVFKDELRTPLPLTRERMVI